VIQPLRLASIRGVRIVQSLVGEIRKHGAPIQHCWITGFGEQNNMSCIGRSIQWIEGVLSGVNQESFTPSAAQPGHWKRLALTGLPAV
jgi:hypothetical protein